MSQQYVEMVRAATEAVKNPEGIERLAHGDLDVTIIDPEIEWDSLRARDLVPDLVDVYWGHEGVRTYWRRWLEAWRYIEFDIQDIVDADDKIVVLICNQRQWGRHTGIVSKLPPFALIYTFRDGKVVRFRFFPDHGSALKAVGLTE